MRFTPKTTVKMIAAIGIVAAALATDATAQTVTPADAPADRSPWVGLRVKPVPTALSVHLAGAHASLKRGHGLMVVNIVVDSPADRAGLRRFDIITELDGAAVTDQLGRFVQMLGRRRPGDHVKLSVIRQGKARPMTVTVGASQPDQAANYVYRYDEQPTGIFEERTEYRGTVLTKGADGWVARDIAALDPALFSELPEEVRGKVLNWAGRVVPTRRTSVVRDGQTIELIRDAGGSLTVRKSMRDEAGQERVATQTYATPDELAIGDPVAFDLHQRIAADPVLSPTDGMATSAASGDTLPLDPDTPTPEGLRRTLADAELYQKHIRAYEKFLADYAGYLRNRLDEEGSDQPMPATWRELLDRANRNQIAPEREFTVDNSGRIDVRIRKSAGDLVISFRNEQEMQEMYPRLYEQYRKLVEGEE